MKKHSRTARCWALATTVALAGGLSLCACGAQTGGAADTQPESNDTVVLGTLDAYDPDTEHKAQEGASLGFDEESNLQQEKTAGAAGGAVQSSIDPLEPGCTAYSDGESTIGFEAGTGEPALVPHGSANGTKCLSCHAEGDQQIPASHQSAAIGDEQCVTCHSIE